MIPSGPPVHQRCDAELLALVRAGHATAYGELYRRHEASARRLARSLVRRDDVDDVVAESFARMLRAIAAGKGPVDHPVRYLMVTVRTTATNLHIQHGRAGDLHARLRGEDAGPPGPPPVVDEQLHQAFRSLSHRWRQVIWWSTVEGVGPSEIGRRLGMSANAASALTYRARRGLRDAYEADDAAVPRADLAS